MKVMVNGYSCDGHALCVGIAPQAFQLGTDGKAYALFITVPPEQEDAVRQARNACPQGAVMVIEELTA
jgi:ferredoxin